MIRDLKRLPATWLLMFCLTAPSLALGSDQTSAVRMFNLRSTIQTIARHSISSRIEKSSSDTLKALRREDWDWGAGVLMFGLTQAFECTGDSTIFNFVRAWLDLHLKQGIRLSHTDQVAPAAVVAELICNGHLDGGTDLYQSALRQTFEFLMAEQIELSRKAGTGAPEKIRLRWRGRVWLDDLFMTVPFMIRWSQISARPDLLDSIAQQFFAYQSFLRRPDGNSALLKHGTYLAKDYKIGFIPLGWLPDGHTAWARGHGWYLAAMADFLARVPNDSQLFDPLLPHFRVSLEEIIGVQKANGLVPTILDDTTSAGEVSATALLVFATAVALKHHWLSDQQYYRFISQGVAGILQHCSDSGQITGVSAGTGVFPCTFLYKIRPQGSHPWGDGSVLMALTAVMDLVTNFWE